MKKLIIVIVLIIVATNLKAQDIKLLNYRIDSLNTVLLENEKQNDLLRKEIDSIMELRNKVLFKSEGGETYVCFMNTSLYETASIDKVLAKIKSGNKISVIEDLDGSYYKAIFNNITGYVFKTSFEPETEIIERQRLKEEEERKKQEAKIEKRKNLIAKYGKTKGQKIIDGRIWIGMTKEMLIDSWGEPDDINRTVGSFGVHEQCIYGNSYVYLEDGILTTWQD
jgi:hypothetical protein